MSIDAGVLRTLHRLHRQISDLRGRLERGPKQIVAGRANVQRLVQQTENAKETYKRTRMTVDEKELTLKQREGRIADIRARLNACSSNKEYQAYLEQIAADEQANSVLSDEILELLEKVSTDQESVAQAEAEAKQAHSELERLQKRIADQKGTLEADLARISNELKSTEAALPADIRSEYERVVKGYGEDALAPLDGEVCGGCYQMITAQMLNELKLARLVFCKSCGRILYEPEETRVS